MRDSGDGAGDDEADTGTKNITREHEMALAANAREMLEQTERALAPARRGHLRALRGLRQADRQGADAGVSPRHALRRGQAEAGAARLIRVQVCRTLVLSQAPRLRDSRGRGGAHHRYAGQSRGERTKAAHGRRRRGEPRAGASARSWRSSASPSSPICWTWSAS